MSTIITKFSDHIINTIEFFIQKIEEELNYRDITNLTNNKIDKIVVSKQHPLVILMDTQLSENRRDDNLITSLLPAIGVTPGTNMETAFTFGKSFTEEPVNNKYIDELKKYLSMTNKEILSQVLITKDQIENIIAAHKRNTLTSKKHEWKKLEEIIISIWADSPDLTNLFSQLMDSFLSEIQIGFVGDNSEILDMKIKSDNRGLSNFNYGRTLYGTEYTITHTNTFNNYTIYSEEKITDIDFQGEYRTPGEENG